MLSSTIFFFFFGHLSVVEEKGPSSRSPEFGCFPPWSLILVLKHLTTLFCEISAHICVSFFSPPSHLQNVVPASVLFEVMQFYI